MRTFIIMLWVLVMADGLLCCCLWLDARAMQQPGMDKMHNILLARLMGQYYFACWRLSSSSVMLPVGGRPLPGRARGRSGS